MTNKMGSMPVKKLLMSMSLPAVFAMLVQALYNIVDSIFVSRISEEALSAVTLAFPIQMIIIAICVGSGVGINSVISRKLGEGKKAEAGNVAEHGILILAVMYLGIAVVAFLFANKMFNSFTNNPKIMNYGIMYIKIIMFFSFGRLLAQAGMSALQGSGDMAHPMKAQVIGAVINIILDPILIFGWFSAPALGVGGAAIATVIGQIVSMIYIYFILFSKTHNIKIGVVNFHFKWSLISKILKVSIPAIIMQGIMSLMLFGMNIVLVSYNDLASTALGIYYKIQSLVFLPILGLGQGVLPIIGYNYGAKKKDRIKETIKLSLVYSVCFMLFGTVIFQLFPLNLLGIFNSSNELTEIGVKAFRAISLSFPFAGASIVFASVFQGVGKAHYSMIISLIRQLILLLPCAYMIGVYFGLNCLWLAYPITEVVSLVFTFFLLRPLYKYELDYKDEYMNEAIEI